MPRNAASRKCRSCKTPVLIGPNDDLAAFIVTVDPTPLSLLGEALALLAGRDTYHLRATRGGGRYLNRRDRWQIAGQPAGSSERLWPFDVVAGHVCNSPPLPGIESQLPSKSERKDSDNANVGLFEEIPY